MHSRIALNVVVASLGLVGPAAAQDCNSNGLDDACDIDCGVPAGSCDLPGCGRSNDCNANSRPDDCDLVQPMFFGLGHLSGENVSSRADGVSADGFVVVGGSSGQAFRWTRSTGMVGLGYLPGSNGSEAFSTSADGSVVVGRSLFFGPWFFSEAGFRWTNSGGMEGLDAGAAYGVSADGSVVVGGDCNFLSLCTYCQAFRWTSVEGTIGLGHLPGGMSDSVATGVSADGSVVVGYSDLDWLCGDSAGFCPFDAQEPFRWTAGGGMIGLGLPSCSGIHADDVSADGLVVVGTTDYDYGAAFRWTADGELIMLGDLPGGSSGATGANAVSADGSVVVGFSESSFGREAFVWDATHGMRSMRAVLVDEYGLDLTGWTLTSARDISADGRTIVGYGTSPDGSTEAWVATLPSEDTNANGIPDECDGFHAIPTVSEWGLVVTTLLLLTAAKIFFSRHSAALRSAQPF